MDQKSAHGSPEPHLLTRRQVAQRLAVTPRTIRRWQLSGRITAVVLNFRVVRYELSEVQRLVAEGRCGAAAEGGAR